MLAVAFGNYVCSSLTIGIFLYVAQTVESVLAVAFGNKLCWFESHYRHISLCSPVERVLAVAFGNKYDKGPIKRDSFAFPGKLKNVNCEYYSRSLGYNCWFSVSVAYWNRALLSTFSDEASAVYSTGWPACQEEILFPAASVRHFHGESSSSVWRFIFSSLE